MVVQWWKNLSVSKKLYSVVGLMALLIATELFTLLFAMNTLSAVRALVFGEGMWSKAQKDAVQSLQKYAITQDPNFLAQFNEHMKVSLGDRKARLELEKKDMNYQVVLEGFIAGRIHPDDVPPVVRLLRRFNSNHYLQSASGYWREGDELVIQLINLSHDIQMQIQQSKVLTNKDLNLLLTEITNLNNKFTVIEDAFSTTLGDASRWMENILMMALVLAVITIEGFGLFLTISFTGGLSRVLKELRDVTSQVGLGDFSRQVPVHSRDELGQLAESINSMTLSLRNEASQRQQAEHASHTKNLFLANMSHEIRTPLNAILGFTDLLKDPDLSPESKVQYLDIIKRTGINLATIINDILDITKIEAEQMKIEKSGFSLPVLLRDLELLLRLRCDEKGLDFSIKPIGNVSEFIISDPVRLRQILINIVGNAIKYTDRGSVHVTYEVLTDQLLFIVKDTGKGIPQSSRPLLFKPFSQGDSSSQKKYGGTGLGLILSKKLAHLLGGDVELVESEPDKGSVFTVHVAYEPRSSILSEHSIEGSAVSAVADKASVINGKKILVVEDTEENQLLLRIFLSKLGASIDIADNGQAGVQKALHENYDLVLMDMQMPVMDGYTATQILRNSGYKVPIVALTAYAMQGDRDKTLQAGCTDYLSKPVDRNNLVDVVSRYVN